MCISLGDLETRLGDLSSKRGAPLAPIEHLERLDRLEDDLTDLSTVAPPEGISGVSGPTEEGPEAFMESLTADTTYEIDLVPNFATDVAVDPLSLDEFIEL